LHATRSDLLDGLIHHKLLLPTANEGVYGTSEAFEAIVSMLDSRISALAAADGAEWMRFPPVTSRGLVESCGYLQTFPQFLGMIHCFCGDERAHLKLLGSLKKPDRIWSDHQAPADLVLTPAACYPVYPIVAARGPVPDGGALVDVASYCFRREPSRDPARLQAFRLREFVRIGAPADVAAFRDAWLDRALSMIETLGLRAAIVPANDPFFGAQHKFLADYQDENRLKFELKIPVTEEDDGTACMSFNCHLDHFAKACGLCDADGAFVHSGCVGFGMERLALALISTHGFEVGAWKRRFLP
jgi:seryl-tRNA synthetase